MLPRGRTTAASDRFALPPFPLVVALWTVPACLSTFETVMFGQMTGHPIAWWRAFAAEAPAWYLWAAMTPVIIWMGQRFPLGRNAAANRQASAPEGEAEDSRRKWAFRLAPLAIHLLASLTVGLLSALLSASMDAVLRPSGRTFLVTARAWFLSELPLATLAYFAVVAVSYGLINGARLRARERDAAELAAQLTEAKLGALKMQLQPHFLFNSLNAIMALVRDQDTRGAVRSLGLLGDVLRSTLVLGSTQEVPLRTEMEIVERYLAMEQVRLGSRITVRLRVPDELLDCAVPTFILQPLVENALRHGIAPVRSGGRVTIGAAHTGSDLTLTVEDTGRGLPPGWAGRDGAGQGGADGLGLANTRARLAALYGTGGRLAVAGRSPPVESGAIATITIPFRRVHDVHDRAASPEPDAVTLEAS